MRFARSHNTAATTDNNLNRDVGRPVLTSSFPETRLHPRRNQFVNPGRSPSLHRSRPRLASVLGVDANVFVGQITGQDVSPMRTPPEIDADGELRMLHDAPALLFGIA